MAGQVVDATPGSVIHRAIELLGTHDKQLLLLLIVVICLALGALAGVLARSHRAVVPVVFAAAAALGVVAGLNDPLTSHGVVVLAAIGAALAGSAALLWLLRLLDRTPVPSDTPAIPIPGTAAGDRRAFLTRTGVIGAGAAVLAVSGHALTDRDRAATATPEATPPLPAATPDPGSTAAVGLDIPGITPLITPNDAFYRIDTAFSFPRVDLATWRLRIDGAVDQPLELSYEELLSLPQVSVPLTIACVSNTVGGDLIGTAMWQGVPLTTLLDRAGVQPGGTQIVGRSVDGFTAGFPTEAASDGRTALLVVGMNGETLPVKHGFPARLVVEGLYGYVSATKWLRSIELRGWEDVDGYWVPLGWSKAGPVKTQSRIDVPRSGATLEPGKVPIAGVAWAPDRGISRVEISIDDGPWVEATLGDTFSNGTWRQWVHAWTATPGRHTIRARATDEAGVTQTSEVHPVEPDGATGYPTRIVTVR